VTVSAQEKMALNLIHTQLKMHHSFQFVYRGEVLVKRQLDQINVQKVIEMIKKIKPVN
jgi:hypothetical protein